MHNPSPLEAIFFAALQKDSAEERAEYLNEACDGDAGLRQRVEKMLAAGTEASRFLESSPVHPGPIWDELSDRAGETDLLREQSAPDNVSLGFLEPAGKSGVLGRLGHYEVLEMVGRGGMGTVLKAFDEKLQRVVAVKVMAVELATNAACRRRFTREARAAAAISHEHIVTIHAVEDSERLPYLVMQYVSGLSLQQRIDRDGPLEVVEIVRIGMQTAAGLAAAHAQGLIHRDIKPANILLENGVERVKLTDFGLARAAADASLTQTGVVAGTPQYMSPEQAKGEPLDQRSDLFSLGSVLYAMCTGRAPFQASGTIAVLKRLCEDTPEPIGEVNPGIPHWLVELIGKLHSKDASNRFASAADVADLLSRHLAHLQHPSINPLPATLPAPGDSAAGRRSGRRRRWVVPAAVMLCLGTGLGLSEATGVTELRATVVRILTAEGTLVVEVDDPGVQVTVEGDGGLVINVAGAQEVRLRPGSYRVQATKDGRPVKPDRDMVTITRGDKQVVRVRLEENRAVPDRPFVAPIDRITSFQRLVGHQVAVFDVACAPDGKQAVSIGGDGTLRVWNLEERREVRRIERPPPDMRRALSVSPDGSCIAVGGDTGLVFVFDLASGEELLKLAAAGKEVASTCFSPDNKHLATGTAGSGIQLWDLKTGQEIRRFEGHGGGRNYGLEFSRDGAQLLSASGDRTARLWHVETAREIRRFAGHADEVYSATFSPDGRRVATSSVDRTIRIWDASSGQLIRSLQGHTHTVKRVRYLPDGRHLISGADDKTIRVWNVADGREEARITADTHVTSRFAVAPDGRRLLSAGGYAWDADSVRLRFDEDTDIRVWQLPERLRSDEAAGETHPGLEQPGAVVGEVWHRPPGHVYDIALSSDGQRAVACLNCRVFAFDPHSGEILETMAVHEDLVRGVAVSPDGRWIASGGFDATVRLWDSGNPHEVRPFATERVADGGTGRPFSQVAFSPDGRYLLAGSRNDLLMWELESGDLVRRFAGHTNAPRRVVFSPGGELVASGAHDGTARVWHTETGEPCWTLREGSHWIVDVDFSPDGKFLATGGRTVMLWDVETGRERWRFPVGARSVEGMAFTPDGRLLLAGAAFSQTAGGELIVLDAATGREIHRAGGLPRMVFDIKIAPDSRSVFIADSDGMRLWWLPESLQSAE